MTISRDEFNKVNEPTFQRCLEAVKRSYPMGSEKSAVNEIVLVGGSTAGPRVQEILTEYFDGKPLNKSVHPDEAVAYGAAVQGAILAGVRDKQTSKVLLMDVVPLSLGVECEGRHFGEVVTRNTSIPCKKKLSSPRCTTTKLKSTNSRRTHVHGRQLVGRVPNHWHRESRTRCAENRRDFEVNTNGLLTATARDRVTAPKLTFLATRQRTPDAGRNRENVRRSGSHERRGRNVAKATRNRWLRLNR